MSATASNDDPIHILLAEDEPDLRSALRYNLKGAGYVVTDVVNGAEALSVADAIASDPTRPPIDIIVSDIMMPELDGIAMATALRTRSSYRDTPLMFLTAKGETADRLEGFRVGADDYLTKPFDLEELLARVRVQARRALMARKMRSLLENEPEQPGEAAPTSQDLYAKVALWEQRFPALAAIRTREIVGQSPKMLALLREILIRAPGGDPVLIVGDTGTGKTGVAEALYQLGPRTERPFRVVNCAELAAADSAITLGKLFGFGTGSGLAGVPKEGQPGLLEDVDGGTLFLDEIHHLPLEAKAMLLLPIEGRSFHPAAGKAQPKKVDIKFIFASNLALKAEAEAGRFPADLYQRLSASQIRVPSLSERRDDIPALAEHFLDECKDEFELSGATLAPSLMRALVSHAWAGNVRELRSTIREVARRAAFELDTVLTTSHLPADFGPVETSEAHPVAAAPSSGDVPGATDDGGGFWNELEVRELSSLRKNRFKITAAEQELGLSSKSRTLTNHLRGMCFKAIVHCAYDTAKAARLVVGRDDEALLDRTVDRIEGYLDMVDRHTRSHTTRTLFNNLPRDYRKFVEAAIERARAHAGE